MNRPVGTPVRSYLFLASAMLIVGTSVVASKLIVATMPIYTASALRFLLAAALLLTLNSRAGGIPHLPLRVHLVVSLQALAGLVVFNSFLLLGLDRTTAIASGIITSSTPAIIALMAVALGDRLRPVGWSGVTLAVAGIVVVNSFSDDQAGGASQPLFGALLVLLAVIGEALYTVLGKIAGPSLHPLPMATLVTLYGGLLFLPLAATDIRDLRPREVPLSGWLALLYLAVVVTVVAFAFWFQGLQHVQASTAGAFTGMIPIGTIVATVVFLDESVTVYHLLGVVVVMLGIVLVTQGMRPVQHEMPPRTAVGVPTYRSEADPAPSPIGHHRPK